MVTASHYNWAYKERKLNSRVSAVANREKIAKTGRLFRFLVKHNSSRRNAMRRVICEPATAMSLIQMNFNEESGLKRRKSRSVFAIFSRLATAETLEFSFLSL